MAALGSLGLVGSMGGLLAREYHVSRARRVRTDLGCNKGMPTETQPTCVLISQSGTYHGKQGLEYLNGVSSETAGARALCLHVVTIPPGGRAKPHLHENHESAVYVISGEAGMWYGEGLRQHMWMRAGD